MALTTEQQRDLGRKLAELQGLRMLKERGAREMLRLDMQWREAHARELELRSMITTSYGESAAPPLDPPLAYPGGSSSKEPAR